MSTEPHKVRRVVTGHDELGRSIIVLDNQPSTIALGDAAAQRQLTELWATVANANANAIASARPSPTLGSNASEIRMVEMPPGSRRELHRTDTLDYGIVLAGEVHLVLERGEAMLRTGDIVIQRGTMHAWHNRSAHAARMVFINMSGQTTDLRRCPDV